MRLITTPKALQALLNRLMNEHSYFSCLVAWASNNSTPFDSLTKNQHKCRQVIIGTHFYQTHPDFIEHFINHTSFRFIKQPSGIFHPKAFLFWTSENHFDIIIGSPNFTQAAFTQNTEISIQIDESDTGAQQAFADLNEELSKWWPQGEYFDSHSLGNYRKAWNIQRFKIESLSDNYNENRQKNKPFYMCSVAGYSWREYVNLIYENDKHGVIARLKTIETCRKLFESTAHFSNLPPESRKFIAGLVSHLKDNESANSQLFGYMGARGDFASAVINNAPQISYAIDEIPLIGEVTKIHYDRFISHFSRLFNQNYIGVASRLLAMKRPDKFYCLTRENKRGFCADFDLPLNHFKYENYWHSIVGRLESCDWWINPAPLNDVEIRISTARAAFLDAIYYQG